MKKGIEPIQITGLVYDYVLFKNKMVKKKKNMDSSNSF